MSLVNIYEFKKYVNRYKGDRHAIKFICCDQFMLMSFISSRTDSDQETYRLHLTFILSTFTGFGIKAMPKATLLETNDKQRKHIRIRNLYLTWMKWSIPLIATRLSYI